MKPKAPVYTVHRASANGSQTPILKFKAQTSIKCLLGPELGRIIENRPPLLLPATFNPQGYMALLLQVLSLFPEKGSDISTSEVLCFIHEAHLTQTKSYREHSYTRQVETERLLMRLRQELQLP